MFVTDIRFGFGVAAVVFLWCCGFDSELVDVGFDGFGFSCLRRACLVDLFVSVYEFFGIFY